MREPPYRRENVRRYDTPCQCRACRLARRMGAAAAIGALAGAIFGGLVLVLL